MLPRPTARSFCFEDFGRGPAGLRQVSRGRPVRQELRQSRVKLRHLGGCAVEMLGSKTSHA